MVGGGDPHWATVPSQCRQGVSPVNIRKAPRGLQGQRGILEPSPDPMGVLRRFDPAFTKPITYYLAAMFAMPLLPRAPIRVRGEAPEGTHGTDTLELVLTRKLHEAPPLS
jgi:hypothetical protein